MFLKVKNVNVESPKKRSKLLVLFGALFPLSSPRMLVNGFIKAAFILFWEHELFLLGRHELILLGTRIVHDLFRINETMNGH